MPPARLSRAPLWHKAGHVEMLPGKIRTRAGGAQLDSRLVPSTLPVTKPSRRARPGVRTEGMHGPPPAPSKTTTGLLHIISPAYPSRHQQRPLCRAASRRGQQAGASAHTRAAAARRRRLPSEKQGGPHDGSRADTLRSTAASTSKSRGKQFWGLTYLCSAQLRACACTHGPAPNRHGTKK